MKNDNFFNRQLMRDFLVNASGSLLGCLVACLLGIFAFNYSANLKVEKENQIFLSKLKYDIEYNLIIANDILAFYNKNTNGTLDVRFEWYQNVFKTDIIKEAFANGTIKTLLSAEDATKLMLYLHRSVNYEKDVEIYWHKQLSKHTFLKKDNDTILDLHKVSSMSFKTQLDSLENILAKANE
jgi:hypothetical protein